MFPILSDSHVRFVRSDVIIRALQNTKLSLDLIQRIRKSRRLRSGKIRETKYEVRKTRTLGKPKTFSSAKEPQKSFLWKTTDPRQLTNEKVTRRTTSKSLKYSYGTYILFRNSFRAALGVESSHRIAGAAMRRASVLLLCDPSTIPSHRTRKFDRQSKKKKKNWDRRRGRKIRAEKATIFKARTVVSSRFFTVKGEARHEMRERERGIEVDPLNTRLQGPAVPGAGWDSVFHGKRENCGKIDDAIVRTIDPR